MDLLGRGIGLAGDELGLLVNVVQAAQQSDQTALGIGHAEGLLHPMSNRFRREIEVLLEVKIQPRQLVVIEEVGTAVEGRVAQGLEPILAVTLKVTAYRIGIDL